MLIGGKHQPSIGAKMSYAEFLTWLNNNAAKYTKVADGRTAMQKYAGTYVNTTLDASNNMYGTPYKEWFTWDSWMCTIARHAHPSLPVFNDNVTNQKQVLLRFTAISSRPSYIALNRNGFTSKAYTTYNGAQCIDFIYYDYTLESVVRYNPFLDNAPVAFNGVLI